MLGCLLPGKAANTQGFQRIETSDGLTNSQVNCIFKDSSGFLWFGTATGLSRFDGYRFRNFYQNGADTTTLKSNFVNDMVEPADGKLWIRTDEGYCIFDPKTESFERKPERWMAQNGMNGLPERAWVDSRGNLVIVANEVGCWYKDMRTGRTTLFPMGDGKGCIPTGNISCITGQGRSIVLIYSDGLMVRIDPWHKRIVWQNEEPRSAFNGNGSQGYFAYIDSQYNYFVYTNGHTMVYSSKTRRWFYDISLFFASAGIKCPDGQILVKNMCEDQRGNLWIATEHRGLIRVNLKQRLFNEYTYSPSDPYSMPDNTLQCVFADKDNAIWAGTLRNGAAYWSQSQTRFGTIPAGDICTMAEDKLGRVWMGTNDAGIVCYDPHTGQLRRYGASETGLGSDVVVCSLCSRDGTLWFGTYNGGMTRYKDGRFTPIKASRGGLGVNSVWALAETKQGMIVVGTLGAGVQMLDPKTMIFTTYDMKNSSLTSDYIASLFVGFDEKIYIGHSQNFSVLDTHNGKITNYPQAKSGELFASRAVTQVICDRRGLVWCANMSGLNVYDPETDRIYALTDNSQMACSVTEDLRGDVWVALSHGVTRFSVTQEQGEWRFFGTSFDDMDGLQSRRLNYRSILTARKGDILVGGQDGVNIISPNLTAAHPTRANALFSGLMLFDRTLSVGEKFQGRVILDHALNAERTLELKYSENAFTVLLASDHISLPQKARFLYRLDGFNDSHWLMTADGQPAVTYTNLSPGEYTLQVKVVNRDGSVSPEISSLSIVIDPPFWLTGWAFALYVLALALLIWAVWRVTIHRQIARMRIEQIQKEAERNRKLDEMKLSFFASVSHELRTPLTLIISPIRALLKKETDEDKRSMYGMILRNANRLLDLVNQTLDLRRIEKNKAELNLGNGDVVKFVSELCDTFRTLSGRKVDISFTSEMDTLAMSFDDDKLEKIVTNLISNALKFTPDGGQIKVRLSLLERGSEGGSADNNVVKLTVADNGSGITDEDKKRIFDRFFQARNSKGRMMAGSGIGLNLVKEFCLLHGGDVAVADNPGGGTVFTVSLPYRFDSSLPEIRADLIQEQAEATAEQGVPYAGSVRKESDNIVVASMNNLLKKGEYEVLVVDDNQDFLEFMRSQLSEIYNVETASNGREALRMVRKHRPDIILSDVQMPEMDGNELCRVLKADPKTERIPFVMLTARLSNEHKIEGLTNGADSYITKPFNFDLLNLRIANLIKWRNATPVGEKVSPQIKQEEITSVDEKFVRQATTYVESHLTDPELSVETLAEAVAMSRVHLYKRLLTITGSTPMEFIRAIRLRHAARLLKEGQLNVSEVAYKVGFNNPRYFSRYFKEMYGMMPSEYKKSGAQNEEGLTV